MFVRVAGESIEVGSASALKDVRGTSLGSLRKREEFGRPWSAAQIRCDLVGSEERCPGGEVVGGWGSTLR